VVYKKAKWTVNTVERKILGNAGTNSIELMSIGVINVAGKSYPK